MISLAVTSRPLKITSYSVNSYIVARDETSEGFKVSFLLDDHLKVLMCLRERKWICF